MLMKRYLISKKRNYSKFAFGYLKTSSKMTFIDQNFQDNGNYSTDKKLIIKESSNNKWKYNLL